MDDNVALIDTDKQTVNQNVELKGCPSGEENMMFIKATETTGRMLIGSWQNHLDQLGENNRTIVHEHCQHQTIAYYSHSEHEKPVF